MEITKYKIEKPQQNRVFKNISCSINDEVRTFISLYIFSNIRKQKIDLAGSKLLGFLHLNAESLSSEFSFRDYYVHLNATTSFIANHFQYDKEAAKHLGVVSKLNKVINTKAFIRTRHIIGVILLNSRK